MDRERCGPKKCNKVEVMSSRCKNTIEYKQEILFCVEQKLMAAAMTKVMKVSLLLCRSSLSLIGEGP